VRFPYFVYNPWVSGAANYNWLAANMPSDARSVAIDIEVRKTDYAPALYAAEVVKFLALCKTRGWKTIIYTAQWFLPYLSTWTPSVDYWWAQYPDKAYYFGGVTTWEGLKLALDKLDKPFNAAACPGPIKMWQCNGDYLILPGTSREIDINIFYGTEAELAAYFGAPVAPPPPPPPPPAPVVTIQSVKTNNALIPNMITVNYTIDGQARIQVIDQRVVTPPPPPPPSSAGLYRIKDDIQARRETIRNGLPSTVRLQGGKSSVLLSPAWMKYVEAINLYPLAYNYQFAAPGVFKDGVGWHNMGEPNRVEQLTFSGNVVEVLRIEGNQAFVKTYYNNAAPPAVVLPMPNTLHPMVQLFTVQYSDHLDMTTSGPKGARYPRTVLIANPGEQLWIDVKELVKI
jgi:hypothetical protein